MSDNIQLYRKSDNRIDNFRPVQKFVLRLFVNISDLFQRTIICVNDHLMMCHTHAHKHTHSISRHRHECVSAHMHPDAHVDALSL